MKYNRRSSDIWSTILMIVGFWLFITNCFEHDYFFAGLDAFIVIINAWILFIGNPRIARLDAHIKQLDEAMKQLDEQLTEEERLKCQKK